MRKILIIITTLFLFISCSKTKDLDGSISFKIDGKERLYYKSNNTGIKLTGDNYYLKMEGELNNNLGDLNHKVTIFTYFRHENPYDYIGQELTLGGSVLPQLNEYIDIQISTCFYDDYNQLIQYQNLWFSEISFVITDISDNKLTAKFSGSVYDPTNLSETFIITGGVINNVIIDNLNE